MGKTTHSFNHRFKCTNIKYRETGISARRSNTSPAHRLQSYLTLLTSHFAVRIHSIRFYVHTYSFYTHDNPNSFNFVRDTPQSYMIIHYVYVSTAYDHQTPIIWSAQLEKEKFLLPHIYDSFRNNAVQLGHLLRFERFTVLLPLVLTSNDL
jgi:hypothetical protein